MQLLESGEMYLETIQILTEKNSHVRSIDIAEYMDFSKASVSRAIKNLKEARYIKVSDEGLITLTKTGKAVANKIYERHKVLTEFLISLGVSEENASNDACKIEHDISDESFTAIKKHMKKI